MAKQYIITKNRFSSGRSYDSKPMELAEAVDYYCYTLETGYLRQGGEGGKKVNLHPKTIKSLITNLNNAASNNAANGCGDSYELKETI